MRFYLPLLVLLGFVISSCRKSKSSEKIIQSFAFTKAQNSGKLLTDFHASIIGDYITIILPPDISRSNLTPTIKFTGVSVSPGAGTSQNFEAPVHYTVTAADGSSRTYIVVVSYQSSTKDMTSFVFNKSDNPSLSADIQGIIRNDSIFLNLETVSGSLELVPAIEHNGKVIYPANKEMKDFTVPFLYTVSAEDGSFKQYKVIVATGHTLYMGSSDGYFYAIDAFSSQLKWKIATGAAIQSSAAYSNGVVYVGSNDGYLYALEASMGNIRWKYRAPGAVNSCPVVRNGLVYFSSNRSLMAVNATAGTLVWSYNYGGDKIGCCPTVANGMVYHNDRALGHGVNVYDAATGERKWSYSVGISLGGPAVVGESLYVTGEGRSLFAIDALTGTGKYNHGTGFGYSGPAIDNGVVYYGNTSLYAIDAATGTQKWSYASLSKQTVNNPEGIFTPAVVANGVVFTGDRDGVIYAIDAATGTLKWQVTGAPMKSGEIHVTYALGTVFTGSHSNYIRAFDAKTGILKWRYATLGPVFNGALVVDKTGQAFYPGISGHQQ